MHSGSGSTQLGDGMTKLQISIVEAASLLVPVSTRITPAERDTV